MDDLSARPSQVGVLTLKMRHWQTEKEHRRKGPKQTAIKTVLALFVIGLYLFFTIFSSLVLVVVGQGSA